MSGQILAGVLNRSKQPGKASTTVDAAVTVSRSQIAAARRSVTYHAESRALTAWQHQQKHISLCLQAIAGSSQQVGKQEGEHEVASVRSNRGNRSIYRSAYRAAGHWHCRQQPAPPAAASTCWFDSRVEAFDRCPPVAGAPPAQ